MLSCTEFIPMYSELMKFIDKEGGGMSATVRYWNFIAEEAVTFNLTPLVKAKGMDGAWEYWSRSLTEEACDLKYIYDKANQEIRSHMRHCPSKGHLLDYDWMEPYEHYCEHCTVVYQKALNENGINMVMDLSGVDHAECRGVKYLIEKGPTPNWNTAVDDEVPGPDKIVLDMKADDNKYLHRDFHVSADNGLVYAGRMYGDNGVREFLYTFVKVYYKPLFEAYRKDGLRALLEQQKKVYETEEMPEVFHAELTDDRLTITVDKCPAVAFMSEHNYTPSKYYVELTRTVGMAIADELDLGFFMEYYDEKTGACKYSYFKRAF